MKRELTLGVLIVVGLLPTGCSQSSLVRLKLAPRSAQCHGDQQWRKRLLTTTPGTVKAVL